MKPQIVILFLSCLQITGFTYCQTTSASTTSENNNLKDYFQLSLEEILNLKVTTTSKEEETIFETPAAVQVITANDILLLNFNSLEEVLEYATGISSINGEGNFFTTTTIRGNTKVNYNTNTLLLIDGYSILNGYHGSFDFQAIPLNSIERIEIVKGSSSVLYGTNAINGVINVITKRSDKDGVNGSGRLKYGTFNNIFTSNAVNVNEGNLQVDVFSDLNISRGEEITYVDERGNSLDLKKRYLGANLVTKVRYEGLDIHFQYYNRAEPAVRTRGFSRAYGSPTDTVGIVVPDDHNEYQLIGGVSYEKKLSEKVQLTAKTNFTKWENRRTIVDGYWLYSSNGVYSFLETRITPISKWSTTFGLNYNNFIGRRYKSQDDDFDIGKENERTNEVAVYLFGNYEVFEKIGLHYGGRYFVSDYLDNTFNNFSPRFSVIYTATENLVLKGIFGRSFRVPTYFEKEVASASVTGNPNLKAENSTSFDFIITLALGSITLDINGFHYQIEDQISRVADPNDPTKRSNLNTGTSEFTGLEANTRFWFWKRLQGNIGYSFVNGRKVDTDEDLPFTYQNMMSASIDFKVTESINFTSSTKFIGDWGLAPSYGLINIGLNYRPSNYKGLTFEFKIDNLLETEVLLPEIARVREDIPTIPLTATRRFHGGIMFRF